MSARIEERLMGRALAEALRGRPSPNPRVGAVVARGGRVVAVGHHRRPGDDHAEVVALKRAGVRARGADLYVTLEPCNHVGRTPPCTEAIAAAGIRRVIVGVRDPNPHVQGGGIRWLRSRGVAVTLGVQSDECRELIVDFTKHVTRAMPFVTLKAAVSLDGRLATRAGDSKWITARAARRQGHRLRAVHDAILIGCRTLRVDDPLLTVRGVPLAGPPPVRVVACSRADIALDSRLVRTARRWPTWVAHTAEGRERARDLARLGVRTLSCRADRHGRVDLADLLRRLAADGMLSVLVEGGGSLHGSLLEAGLVDKVVVFIAPRILGGQHAVPMVSGRGVARVADAFELGEVRVRTLGPDIEVTGLLKQRQRS